MPENGAMVQEETRVSRDPRDPGRAFSWPDDAQVFHGIGLLGNILTGNHMVLTIKYRA